MALRSRIGGMLLGLSMVGMMGVLPSLAQDPAGTNPAAAKKGKSAADARSFRRVPPYFSKVGITTEQKERIYQIRGRNQAEIAALKAKIEELQAKDLAECESVLLEPQKRILAELRAAAKPSRKAAAGE